VQIRPGSVIVTFELLPAEEDLSFTDDTLETLVTVVRALLPCRLSTHARRPFPLDDPECVPSSDPCATHLGALARHPTHCAIAVRDHVGIAVCA
jgi:hypothetical protein